jgi:hypothetical protein
MSEMPSRENEAQEIVDDARAERRLIWQALLAVVVVVAIVVVRQMLL